MTKRKRPVNDDEWESYPDPYIVGTGSYQRTGNPKKDKTKMKRIGFIRQPMRSPPDKTK